MFTIVVPGQRRVAILQLGPRLPLGMEEPDVQLVQVVSDRALTLNASDCREPVEVSMTGGGRVVVVTQNAKGEQAGWHQDGHRLLRKITRRGVSADSRTTPAYQRALPLTDITRNCRLIHGTLAPAKWPL